MFMTGCLPRQPTDNEFDLNKENFTWDTNDKSDNLMSNLEEVCSIIANNALNNIKNAQKCQKIHFDIKHVNWF